MANLRMQLGLRMLALGLSLAIGPLAMAEVERPSELELSASVKQLSDPQFKERELATLLLWKHAARAEDRLRAAAKNGDSEALIRSKRILEAYELGIFPDTPPDIVAGIYEFRDGSRTQKKQFIERLASEDEFESAHRLIASIKDTTLRQELSPVVSARVRARVMGDLLNGELTKVQDVLESAALQDEGMRDLAAFAWDTSKLETLLDERKDDGANPSLWKKRAWQLRAHNSMKEATALGEQHGDKAWGAEVRAADGNPMAFCEGQLMKPNLLPFQRLRLECAQARLQGDQRAVEAILEKIEEWARREPDTYNRGLAIEALILNDRVERAVALYQEMTGQLAFDLHTYRGTYGRAMESLGLDAAQRPPYSPWIDDLCDKITEEDQEALEKALELARRVFGLGEKQEAGRLFQRVFTALAGRPAEQRKVVTDAANVGDRETVTRLLTELVDSGVGVRELHGLLFSGNIETLQQWYGFMRTIYSEKNLVECLVSAWTILDVRSSDAKGTEATRKILTTVYDMLGRLGPGESEGQLYYLFVTAYMHEHYDLAIQYMNKLIGDRPNTRFISQLAGIYEMVEDWEKAAINYEKAWKLSFDAVKAMNKPGGIPIQVEAKFLYLAGKAWCNAGNEKKGAQMMKQASLVCLGDINARADVASAMNQHGDYEKAMKEWALIARLGRMDETNGTWAFVQMAGSICMRNPGMAADYHERATVARDQLNDILHVNSPSSRFTYSMQLRARVHQWRAQSHLKEGNTDKATESIKTFIRTTPGNASIGEELLPMLEEAGQVELAYEYYQQTRALALEACTLFPESAMAHNNLAWLDSRSRRNLDDAFYHAQRAITLLPDSAAYMDTMAEVHFANGDREKALDWSGRAIKLTPFDQELQGQRERFESAPLPTKR